MAFALTNARFYKVEIPSAVDKRGLQGIEMTVTRLTADTDLDFGDVDGTFWTAAIADATYGTLSTLALGEFKKIASNIEAIVSLEITAVNGVMLRVASASTATQYDLTNAATFPETEFVVTLGANAAPATLKIRALLSLNSDVNTVDYTF